MSIHSDKIRLASLPNPEECRNPYLKLLYRQDNATGISIVDCPGIRFKWLWKNRFHVDILHVHWPSYYYQSSSFIRRWKRLFIVMLYFVTARLLGVHVVWTIHNIYPHIRAPGCIDHAARWILVRVISGTVAHDRKAIRDAQARFGLHKDTAIVPLMSFHGAVPPAADRRVARNTLGIAEDAIVYLHFGVIRGNKNIGEIVRGFKEIRSDQSVLVIAGEPESPEIAAELAQLCSGCPAIHIHYGMIPEEQLPFYFGAADIAVTAANTTTQSSLLLYLTYGLPVILPQEQIPEDAKGLPCFIPYDKVIGIAQALRDSLKIDLYTAREAALSFANQRHPDRISTMFAEAMRCFIRRN